MPTDGGPSRGADGSGSVAVGAGACADAFAEDERMLQSAGPALRVTVLTDRALSYGVGVRPDAPFVERARRLGLAPIGRSSGGSGVLHAPGDLAWSVVLPRSHSAVGRDYARAYGRLGAGAVRFLGRHRLSGAWTTPPDLSADCCVLSGRGRVLSVGGRILGGAAQHVTPRALLHHGMIFRSLDRELLGRLFEFPDPTASARLVGLDELGVHDPAAGLARELADELAPLLGARTG